MMNAYKMYHKTRPLPSPSSVNRSKLLLAKNIPLHPLLNITNSGEAARTS